VSYYNKIKQFQKQSNTVIGYNNIILSYKISV